MIFFPKLGRATMLATALTLTPTLISAALPSPVHASEKAVSRINVTGEGKVFLAPDIATLQLGVMAEGKTAREALTKNNTQMRDVIDAMKAAGIDPKDLQTSNFSIQPKYVYHRPKNNEEQKPPRIVGYTVSNNLTVIIRDLAKVGEILDQSVSLGINSGGHISFGNDDPSAAIKEARAAAMKDAIDRAETLLGAAGASLGKIIEINESFQRPRPVPLAKGRMMADAAMAESVPIEGGENAYSVNVSVSWEILQ